MCGEPFVQRRHADTEIISHLLLRQPTGQRDAHRIFAEFVSPAFQFDEVMHTVMSFCICHQVKPSANGLLREHKRTLKLIYY